MRRFLQLLVAMTVVAGCGKPEAKEAPTSSTPAPKAVIQVPKGESVKLGDVTEQELGAPYYPGSTSIAGATARTKDSSGETLVSTRESGDAVGKIRDWYVGKLPKATLSSSATESVLSVPAEGGEGASILISTGDHGRSRIVISRRLAK